MAVFFVVDQGIRVQTPIDRLLNTQQVGPVDKTDAAHPVSPRSVRADNVPVGVSVYQNESERNPHQTTERKPVATVDEVMNKTVITASTDDTVAQAWKLIEQHRIHHLPVLNETENLVGILSDRDLLRYFIRQQGRPGAALRRISEIMSGRVVTAEEHSAIRLLAEVMTARRFGAIPIVDTHGYIVGIVTRSDIMKVLVRDAPLELWA